MTTSDSLPALLAAGERKFLLRAGTHRFAFTASERTEAGVVIDAYPGESPVIDGTGLDQHLVYLGPGADWTFGAVRIQGFVPTGSGVIGVGNGASLTLRGTVMRGPGTFIAQTSHSVYFYGTGAVGLIEDADIWGAPGAALQSYRGTPVVTVNRGRFAGEYISALMYSGTWTFNDVAFVPGPAYGDIQKGSEGSYTLNNCTGTGPGGSVDQS